MCIRDRSKVGSVGGLPTRWQALDTHYQTNEAGLVVFKAYKLITGSVCCRAAQTPVKMAWRSAGKTTLIETREWLSCRKDLSQHRLHSHRIHGRTHHRMFEKLQTCHTGDDKATRQPLQQSPPQTLLANSTLCKTPSK